MSHESILAALMLTLLAACSEEPASDDAPSTCEDCPLWCEDHDGDGYGSQACVRSEEPPSDVDLPWADNGDDCDDQDARTFPGVAQLESPDACMSDEDADGWGAVAPASAGAVSGTDCDDQDAATFPGAAEHEQPANACMRDADGDGWGAWRQDGELVESGVDCDDDDAALFDCAHCDLLLNSDAEQDTSGWTGRIITHDLWNDEGKIVEPVSGGYFFIVGYEAPFFEDMQSLPPCEQDDVGWPICTARQTVLFDEPLPAGAPNRLQLRGYLHVWEQDGMINDTATLRLSWLSLADEELPCGDPVSSSESRWVKAVVECEAPSEAVKGMVVTLEGELGLDSLPALNYLDAYFDSLMLLDLSCGS